MIRAAMTRLCMTHARRTIKAPFCTHWTRWILQSKSNQRYHDYIYNKIPWFFYKSFNQSINNEYMNGVGLYKTNIYGLHSSLWVKTNGPSVTAIVIFCFGAAPLRQIVDCSHLGPIILTRASHGRIYLYTNRERRVIASVLW